MAHFVVVIPALAWLVVDAGSVIGLAGYSFTPGAFARQTKISGGKHMKVKKVKTYECPECGGSILKDELIETTSYQCGECGEIHEDKDEAKECCKEE